MTDELKNLTKIDNFTLLALIDKVFIQKLDDSDLIRIKNYLMQLTDNLNIIDSVTVEKIEG